MQELIGLGLLHGIGLAFGIFLLAANALGAEVSRPSQWEATVEAAKKEGQVNLYLYRYGKVLDVFRQDYPEIRPDLRTGTGAQITTKLLTERRAGRFLADVVRSSKISTVRSRSRFRRWRGDRELIMENGKLRMRRKGIWTTIFDCVRHTGAGRYPGG